MRIVLKPGGAVALAVLFTALLVLVARNLLPAGQAGIAPSGLPALDAATLYDDAVAPGWSTKYSWTKDLETAAGELFFEGTHSIRAKMQPWEGIKLTHGNFDLTPYDRLIFRVQPGKNTNLLLQVHGILEGNKDPEKPGAVLGPMPADQWVTCVVPLEDVGVAGAQHLDSFTIQEGAGKATETFYIDSIQLVKKGTLGPNGVICPISKQKN